MTATPSKNRWTFWPIHAAGGGWCVAVAIAAYALGIHPVLIAHWQQEDHRGQLAQQQETLDDRQRDVERVREKITEIRREIDATSVELESLDQLNQRLARVAALAKHCGLAIHGAVPGEAIDTQKSLEVPVRLAGQGAYPAITVLLSRLYETYPDLRVDSFELIGNPADASSPDRFEIQLTWHAARDDSTALAE